jgi:hypothetical protein
MTSDDLDRILASEEALHPSSGFTAAVMARVREAAAEPSPLPFPWLRFVCSGLVLAALTALWVWLVLNDPRAEALRSALVSARTILASPEVSRATGTTLGALCGTYVLVILTLRWAGARS